MPKKEYNKEIKYQYWNNILADLKNNKLYCLDLGSDIGENTKWLLNNICEHSESKIYSINNWIDDNIFNKYNNNIKKTTRKNQNIIFNELTFKALIKLIQLETIKFDIIIINTSKDGSDILTDAILAFKLLKPNGIFIFDDYNTNKYSHQILSINSFIKLFESQLYIIYSGYQYIVQKKYRKIKEKISFNNLLNEINNNNNYFNFKYTINKSVNKNFIFKIQYADFNTTFLTEDIQTKYNNINKIYKKKKKYIYKLFEINIYKDISKEISKNFKLLDISNKIVFAFLLRYYIILNKIDKYSINTNILIIDNNKSMIYKEYFYDKYSKLNIYFINKINEIIIDNKYKLIFINDNNLNLLLLINIVLRCQELYGDFILMYEINFTNLLCDCIYFLKIYYKYIYILNKYTSKTGRYIYIYCKNFKGIKSDELTNFNNFYNKLNVNNSINSFLQIKNKTDYNNIKDLLIKIANIKLNSLYNNTNLLIKIIKFIRENKSKQKKILIAFFNMNLYSKLLYLDYII